MAKSRKTAVRGIVEPRLRPSTIAVSVLATVFGVMILYNIFLGQKSLEELQLAAAEAGSTHMSVAAPGKQSRTIMLKYEEVVEDVQRELLATGHFQGLVDGVNGPRTKLAIELYQRENNLEVTGKVSRSLLEHIRYTRKLAQAAEFTGSVAPVANEVEELAPAPVLRAEPNPEPVAATPAKDKVIVKLQERLAKLGYDPGVRSGTLDEETVSAILKFELDHGLAMDGKLSKDLFNAIRAAEQTLAAQ